MGGVSAERACAWITPATAACSTGSWGWGGCSTPATARSRTSPHRCARRSDERLADCRPCALVVRLRDSPATDVSEASVDRVARNEQATVDSVPGRKEIRPGEALVLHSRDRVVTAGHVEVLVTPEQVVDLMMDHVPGRYEHLVQTDASDHGEPMRARVVANGAEDLGQAEEAPEGVTGVTADQREETIAPRRERLSKDGLHDAVAGERWPAPGADAQHVDSPAVDGPFRTPRLVDHSRRHRVGNPIIDEET